MYTAAARLTPDNYYELAVAVYAEMVLAGFTLVGEFHYIHHQVGGKPYTDPNTMGKALTAAAETAGIRLTLLDTCYLTGGVDGRPLSSSQRRFSDGTAQSWLDRVSALGGESDLIRYRSAIHSVRAVPPADMAVVAGRGGPLHAHVSEQPAENADCLAATGITPTQLLDSAGVLSSRFSAVHATHLTEADIRTLSRCEATVVLCPTTERDLADGIGPSVSLASAGVSLAVGTDSHAIIDPFAEASAVELNQRLRSGARGSHTPSDLWATATVGGYRSLGWGSGGTIEPGALADLVAIRTDSAATAGCDPASLLYCATPADVTTVIVGGERIVRESTHRSVDAAAALTTSINRLLGPPGGTND